MIRHVHVVEVVPVAHRRRFCQSPGTTWSIRVDGVDVLKGETYGDRTMAAFAAAQVASSLTALTRRPHEFRESD